MGNQNSIANNDKNHSCWYSSSMKQSKRQTSKKSQCSDEFIIKLHQKQRVNGITTTLLDQRRVVFISLIGLYQTWFLCPTPVLYSSIFMLPLKKKWIYSPEIYEHEIGKTILSQINIFEDPLAFREFIRLLKWKDSQNLVFWMLDEYENEIFDNNYLISPFWMNFSDHLTKLYDPITKSKYKPIKCNAKWWKFSYGKLFKSQYNVPSCKILRELYFVTMKFKSIQEILYQSNPHSLNTILSYDVTPKQESSNVLGFVSKKKAKIKDCYGFVSFEHGCCPDIDENDEVYSDNEGIWMISTEYNEYDLDLEA